MLAASSNARRSAPSLAAASNSSTEAATRRAPYVFELARLTKPRLSSLVIFTAAAGVLLAPGSIGWLHSVTMVMATALLVAGANAFNCLLERDVDAKMQRTQTRPLVTGRVTPRAAGVFGTMVTVAGIAGLLWSSNVLTTALGAAAFFTYVAIYTPLKRYSTTALFVGAVPGALPPLVVWTAVTGSVDPMGMILFAILFAWQLPHFLAISIYLEDDYARGGLRVFALVHGKPLTRWAIVVTSFLTWAASMLPVAFGLADWRYGIIASLLGGGLVVLSLLSLGKSSDTPAARRMFLATLLYLPALLLALALGVL